MSNYEEWNEVYCNKKIINFYADLTKSEIEILAKLGIIVKENYVYTEREYEILKMDIGEYYEDEDMCEEELELVKSLEGTGVSREEYNKLLEKIDKLEEQYCKLYSKFRVN